MKLNIVPPSIKALVLFVFGISLQAGAQSIPNGNFESWNSNNFELPVNYVGSTNTEAIRSGLPFVVTKSTDAFHGTYAAKMVSVVNSTDTIPAIFINNMPQSDNPANWKGGFAYGEKPTGLRGYYKCAISSPDSGFIVVSFYKGGTHLGMYGYFFTGTQSSYAPFNLTFNPPLTQTPDTFIIGFGASGYQNQSLTKNGSMLLIDSISLTGVVNQPSQLNGDFENWQTTVINTPNKWYLSGGGDNFTGGAYKTTDAKQGSGAVELISYLSYRDKSATVINRAGEVSTGWYPRNCKNNCQQQGGYPFTNKIDTLAFWYKYTSANGSKGKFNLNFKKSGTQFMGNGDTLSPSGVYKYVEYPIDLSQTPDSVMVSFQSADWRDTLPSMTGASLKVDEVHFKSQPLTTPSGISKYGNPNELRIYPIPANGFIQVALNQNFDHAAEISLLNYCGQQIIINEIPDWQGYTRIDLNNLPNGIYFLRFKTADQTYYDKKIIVSHE